MASLKLIVRIIHFYSYQVSGFWGESADFEPLLPLCAVSTGKDEIAVFSIASPDFSGFLRISVLFHLKVTKLFVLQQLWLSPSQLIGTYLLQMTKDDSLGNYHNNYC